ncbi:MAG: patatin-like phospholipase family protein [Bauldia sp.]|nr:MAG: patatin-like phospholipase family protein [Bauldia sp.]
MAAARQRSGAPRIGLALSGGGARGLAHIPVLEALDDLGIRPSVIAGTSIGGIVGAGYAAGMSGADIRAYATERFRNRTDVLARLWQLRPKRVGDLFAGGGMTIGQFDAERVLDKFLPETLPKTFAELSIPLRLVATDFYGWQEVVLDDGPLFRAMAASAAIPGLFRPVMIDDRVMIDGGISNPLPFDLLSGECDVIVAVDVVGGPVNRRERMPGPTEAIFGATQLFMQSITREKMRRERPPEILVRPPENGFRVLDFMKVNAIIKSAEPLKDEVKRKLDHALLVA